MVEACDCDVSVIAIGSPELSTIKVIHTRSLNRDVNVLFAPTPSKYQDPRWELKKRGLWGWASDGLGGETRKPYAKRKSPIPTIEKGNMGTTLYMLHAQGLQGSVEVFMFSVRLLLRNKPYFKGTCTCTCHMRMHMCMHMHMNMHMCMCMHM